MAETTIAGQRVEVRELESREVLLTRLFGAMESYDSAVRGLIAHDLAGLAPALSDARRQAEARVEAAEAAPAGPEQAVRALEDEIAVCGLKLTELSGSLDDDDVHLRVEARRWHREYEDECRELHKRLDFAVASLQPLYAERQKAREGLELAGKALEGLIWAMGANPYGEAGQAAPSYQLWRVKTGKLVPVLWACAREDPEWDQAMWMLRELCLRAGYRTTDLPDDAEMAARALRDSGMASAADTPFAPSPSGQDVMAMDKALLADSLLQEQPTRIDDFRSAASAVPRNAPVRDWMRLPGRGAR